MSAPPSKRSGREPGCFHRPADPQRMLRRIEQRLAAVGAVEQHAEARPAVGDAHRRLHREALEGVDPLARRAGLVGDLLQLRAMVDREREERLRLRPPRRRPMDVVQRLVMAERVMRAALLEKRLQLDPGRIFRRAEQPRHGEGAAGVGPGRRGRVRLAPQPAAQEAAHEGVAGAEHVEHLDRKAAPDDAVVDAVRESRRERRRSPSARASGRSSPSKARGCGGAPRGCPPRRRRCGSPPRCRRSGRSRRAPPADAPTPCRSGCSAPRPAAWPARPQRFGR